MTPFEPHLANAAMDWIEKNNGWPHLIVHAAGVGEPDLIANANEAGSALLSVSPSAIGGIEFGDEFVTVKCAFRGRRTTVLIQYPYLLGIMDKNTGAYIAISDMAIAQAVYEAGGPEQIASMEIVTTETAKPTRPKLSIVK